MFKLDSEKQEILLWVSLGFTDKQIAQKMGVTQTHITSTLRWFQRHWDYRTRDDLVIIALQCNLIPAKQWIRDTNFRPRRSLKKDEVVLIKLYVEGHSNEQIAKLIGASQKTVLRWWESIYRALSLEKYPLHRGSYAAALTVSFGLGYWK